MSCPNCEDPADWRFFDGAEVIVVAAAMRLAEIHGANQLADHLAAMLRNRVRNHPSEVFKEKQ